MASWNRATRSTSCAMRCRAGRRLRPDLHRHAAGAELLHPLGADRGGGLPDSVRLRRFLAPGALHAAGERAEIQADHNADLQVEGIVVNQFQPRANLPQRLVQELIDEGLPVLQPYLSSSVKIRESHQQSSPMIFLEPNHKLTLEFVALHDALL